MGAKVEGQKIRIMKNIMKAVWIRNILNGKAWL